MLFDQRLQREVRQEVATVNNERLRPQQSFHILNAATGPEQGRLVLKNNFAIPVRAADR